MLMLGSRLYASTETTSCQQKEGVVILRPSKGLIFSANHVGAAIWTAIQAGETVAAMALGLADTYGITREIAERDCLAFCVELCNSGLACIDRN